MTTLVADRNLHLISDAKAVNVDAEADVDVAADAGWTFDIQLTA